MPLHRSHSWPQLPTPPDLSTEPPVHAQPQSTKELSAYSGITDDYLKKLHLNQALGTGFYSTAYSLKDHVGRKEPNLIFKAFFTGSRPDEYETVITTKYRTGPFQGINIDSDLDLAAIEDICKALRLPSDYSGPVPVDKLSNVLTKSAVEHLLTGFDASLDLFKREIPHCYLDRGVLAIVDGKLGTVVSRARDFESFNHLKRANFSAEEVPAVAQNLKKVVRQLADFWAICGEKNIYHSDAHAGNVGINGDIRKRGACNLAVIDIDSFICTGGPYKYGTAPALRPDAGVVILRHAFLDWGLSGALKGMADQLGKQEGPAARHLASELDVLSNNIKRVFAVTSDEMNPFFIDKDIYKDLLRKSVSALKSFSEA